MELEKIITEVGVVESIAIAQEGGETDFQALESIEMTSEKLSYRNVLSDATTVKSRYPFEEGDDLIYNGDIMEDSFAVVAYTGTGAAQTINTGIESYDINYDVARTMTAGSGNNTEYVFDRATMKLWKYINVTPAAGATLAEGADFTEVADDVEIDFKSSKVWVKGRSFVGHHPITDTLRGVTKSINTDETNAEETRSIIAEFSSEGFTLGSDTTGNTNAATHVAWQWAYNKIKITTTNQGKRAIVAFTEGERSMTLYEGSGVTGHEVPHGLGVVPGLIHNKNLTTTEHWRTQFSNGATASGYLNLSNALTVGVSTTLGITNTTINTSHQEYNSGSDTFIMYSEASKAGQIKIGTYTGTNAANNYIDCGFEVEYVMIKRTDAVASWEILDSSRGGDARLWSDTSQASITTAGWLTFEKNGFRLVHTSTAINASANYLYIAYAKGSKAKKTIGTDTAVVTGVSKATTKNFATIPYTGTGASQAIVTGISSVDFTVAANGSDRWFDRSTFEVKNDAGTVFESGVVEVNTSKVHIKGLSIITNHQLFDGIRGADTRLYTTTSMELASSQLDSFDTFGVTVSGSADVSNNTSTYILYQTLYTHVRWGTTNHNKKFVEAFNPYTNETMVVYQGSGAIGHSVPHSLAVALDYYEYKRLDATNAWGVEGSFADNGLGLDSTSALGYQGNNSTTNATGIDMSTGTGAINNVSGEYILYGKAKSENWTIVEYTGTGAAGNYVETKDVFGNPRRPRRVVIKRTDSTGNWNTIDSERGALEAIELNTSDTAWVLNSTYFEGVSSAGFTLGSVSTMNASGGKYIALVEFDTVGDNGDSYYDVYEGTHNASIEPTSFVNASDTKLEWSLNDGVTYHEAVVATRSEVDGVVTTTFNGIVDATAGNRAIKHKVTKKLDGSTISRIRANIKKGE